jgi:cytochrome c-type biogenesis protein
MENTIQQVSLFAAFAAGLLSFVSPCVLPLVPSYISYVTGLSVEQLVEAAERHQFRKAIIVNSLLFITGFSCVFVALGASASLAGRMLMNYQDSLRKAGGVLIILFGLYLLGVLNVSFLTIEKRLHFKSRPTGYVGSFLVGVAFAAGWTPCVGPVLGTILLYASTTDAVMDGVMLLIAYSLGLGLPLFVAALGVDRFLTCFKQVRGYLRSATIVSGVLLVVVGAMIYANSLTLVTSFLERNGIGVYLGQ